MKIRYIFLAAIFGFLMAIGVNAGEIFGDKTLMDIPKAECYYREEGLASDIQAFRKTTFDCSSFVPKKK